VKVKFLKERKDSGALAFQRKIPLHLTGKAKVYNIKPVVTLPLDLSIGASEVQVVTRIEQRNKQFETLLRFLEQTDHHAVSSADWEKTARAYLEVKGLKAGTLKNVEVGSDEFDYRMDEALGVNADQHRQGWDEVYPDAERMPEQLIDAIYEILQHREGSKRFHLFSDAIDYYKAFKESEINKLAGTGVERERKRREFKKDCKRLDGFLDFTGNQEFTQDNANEELRRYRNHLINHELKKPSTAKRELTVPAAALRRYADEVATNIVITQLKVDGQAASSKQRPVLDLETELPLLWEAAHNEQYGQFERLSIFGIFSGASAAEIVQTQVEDVYALEGYYILGGTKQKNRQRPVIIINQTHLALLTKFKEGYVVGEEVAYQTGHSGKFAAVLRKVTGNPQLVPYSCRHTGKFLANTKGVGHMDVMETMFGWTGNKREVKDNYGRAGIFSKPYIEQMRQITDKILEDLPRYS
jgi:integrase